ncbi:hypothetical protein FQR65_LT05284 [Abscondita terminalis]|nr:hypothetical protein FQR65_LT05284 [Abscondita terminalis]
MPTIYLATPKNSFIPEDELKEKNFNYIVIKKHNYKGINKLKNPISIDLIEEKNYEPSDKYLISFKIAESQGEDLKKCLDSKLKEFLQNNAVSKESILDFLKFLEADGELNVRQLDENDNQNEEINSEKLSTVINSKIDSSQAFLDAERVNPRNSAISLSIDNQSISNSSIQTHFENENVGSTLSLSNPTNRTERPSSFVSLQDLVVNQSLPEYQNKTLSNIKTHGPAIENGCFKGLEKSMYLRIISDEAKVIDSEIQKFFKNPESKLNVDILKDKINNLNMYINDERTVDCLTRYRGISVLKCFATMWGGGRVKSIEYVKELQEQVVTLNQKLALRPTV